MSAKLLPALMGELDIILEQGKDLPISLTWKDNLGVAIDLTGYSAKMQIRPSAADKGTALLEYTSAGGQITLGGIAGTIEFTITDTDNQFGNADLYWELEITETSGLKRPLVGGKATSRKMVVK